MTCFVMFHTHVTMGCLVIWSLVLRPPLRTENRHSPMTSTCQHRVAVAHQVEQ